MDNTLLLALIAFIILAFIVEYAWPKIKRTRGIVHD